MDIIAKFRMSDLETAFLTEFALKLNTYIPFIKQQIKPIIFDLINSSVKNSKEYLAMTTGRLFGEFGEPNIISAIEDVIKAINDNVEIKVQPFRLNGKSIQGSFEVGVLKLDYSDVLNLPSISFISEGGFNIEWLRWLLFEGDTKIISTHSFVMSSSVIRYSRTGTGIMKKGVGWGVPSIYSGTSGDNWLTRALDKIDENIIKELHKIIYNL